MSYNYTCPKGYVLRKPYYREPYVRYDGVEVKGTYVKVSCVRKRVSPHKSPHKSPQKKLKFNVIDFRRYGYYLSEPNNKIRRSALIDAINENGALSTFRQVGDLYHVYNVRNKKEYATRALKDAKWINSNILPYLDK